MARKVRCLSCRKLKIACDEGRPKCEYCASTNRECIYPAPKSRDLKLTNITNDVISDRNNGYYNDHHNNRTLEPPPIMTPSNVNYAMKDIDLSPYGNSDGSLSEYTLPSNGDFSSRSPSIPVLAAVSTDSDYDVNDMDELIRKFSPSYLTNDHGSQNPLINLEPVLYDQGRLNCSHRIMGVSRFEYRLLLTFQLKYISNGDSWPIDPNSSNPVGNIWVLEMPSLWHQSSLLRNCIFSISTMFLNEATNLKGLLQDDVVSQDGVIETEATELKFLTSEEEWQQEQQQQQQQQQQKETELSPSSQLDISTNMSVLGQNDITVTSLKYFEKCLQEHNKFVNDIASGHTKLTVDKAGELMMTSILLFSFLILQPYNVVQLITFNEDETDLIQITRLMKKPFVNALPIIFSTKYHGLLSLSKYAEFPEVLTKSPVIQDIEDQFNLNYSSKYPPHIRKSILEAIDFFELSLRQSVRAHDPAYLYRWIFCHTPEVFDLMEAKDHFCLKLLYYYSCMLLLAGVTYRRFDNILMDFVIWFKDYSYLLFNEGWECDLDRDLYKLTITGFEIFPNFEGLKTFHPSMYV